MNKELSIAKSKEKHQKGSFFKMSDEEYAMLRVLKDKHCLNISATFRRLLADLYNEYENKSPTKS